MPQRRFDPYHPRSLNPYVPWIDPTLLLLGPLMIWTALKGNKRRRRELLLLLLVWAAASVACNGGGETPPVVTPTQPPQQPPATSGPPTYTPPPQTATPQPSTPTVPPTPMPTSCPTPVDTPTMQPVTEEDVTETARSAVGEVGPTIPEDQQLEVEGVRVISWVWGDEPNRDRALFAISWVVRNRVDSSLNFGCTTPVGCAQSPDFQGRDPAYFPSEHERIVARRALERQGIDPTNGAVFFYDLTLPERSHLAEIINLDGIAPAVRDVIQPDKAGFYFFSAEQWNTIWGTPSP